MFPMETLPVKSYHRQKSPIDYDDARRGRRRRRRDRLFRHHLRRFGQKTEERTLN